MPELKTFPVFGEEGRIGTLTAPARFLDSRSEKTIRLDSGGEMSVPADALQVQSDGSFLLLSPSQPASNGTASNGAAAPTAKPEKPSIDKLFREGYSIERVKVDRLLSEPASQRQEGDTLILPVVEEVLVMEKRMMLREEIRITPRRDEVEDVRPLDASLYR